MSDIKHSFELERRELKASHFFVIDHSLTNPAAFLPQYGYETSLSRDRESQHEVVRQMKDTISTLQSSQRSSGLVQSAPVLGGGFPMPHSISITQPAAQVPQPVSVPLSKQSHRDDSKHSSCHSQRRYHHRSHRETTRRPSRSRSPDEGMYRSRSRSPHYSTHTHRASVPVREEAFDRVYDSSTIPPPTVQYTAAVPASSGTASSTGINEYRLGFLDALRTSGTSTAQPPAPAPALAPTPATATTFRAGDTAPDYTTEGHEYSRRHSYIDAPNIRRQRKGIGP